MVKKLKAQKGTLGCWRSASLEVGGRKDKRLEGEKIKLWITGYGLGCNRGKTSAPDHPNNPNHFYERNYDVPIFIGSSCLFLTLLFF